MKFMKRKGRNNMGKRYKRRGKRLQYKKGRRFSSSQLKMGIKTEMEHAKTIRKIHKGKTPKWKQKQVAKMIALDHLKEKRNYYTLMKKYKL